MLLKTRILKFAHQNSLDILKFNRNDSKFVLGEFEFKKLTIRNVVPFTKPEEHPTLSFIK